MPTASDDFGTYALKLWADQCDLYNLTEETGAPEATTVPTPSLLFPERASAAASPLSEGPICATLQARFGLRGQQSLNEDLPIVSGASGSHYSEALRTKSLQ